MTLVNMKVQWYKSILGCELAFEPNITVLVGANESGKSTILEAITHLNHNIPFTGDSKSHTREGKYLNKLPELTYTFRLNSESRSRFVDSFKACFRNISADSATRITEPQIPPSQKSKKSSKENLSKRKILANIIDIAEHANELVVVLRCEERLTRSHYEYRKVYSISFDDVELKLPQTAIMTLLSRFIHIVLLTEIAPIPERISIPDVVHSTGAKGRVVHNLLNIGGLKENEISLLLDDAHKISMLRRACGRLTKTFSAAWKQELTEVNIQSGSGDRNLSIYYVDRAKTIRSPAQRSQGNRWFFSFLTQLETVRREKGGQDVIILIDEPGLYLHPRGQRDLQNQFQRIATHFQLIYSTHMPFLVNRNFPERLRTISKTSDGTVVNNKPYKDRFEALRHNIGITLGDSFILGERHLIVEGITDCMIIATVSALFARITTDFKLDVPHLDLNKLIIVPAGDARYAVTIARFSVACGIPYIVLLDADRGGYNHSKHLIKMEAVNKDHILWTREFLSTSFENSSIEDIIPRDIYLDSLDHVLRLSGQRPVDRQSFPEREPIISILNAKYKKFDKQTIMRHVISRLDVNHVFDESSRKVKDDFQPFVKLFEEVNAYFDKQAR